jgi:hypothetical protein
MVGMRAAAWFAFAISALLYLWLLVGMGMALYQIGLTEVTRELFGTRQAMRWDNIGVVVGLAIGGTFFLCMGLSVLASVKSDPPA